MLLRCHEMRIASPSAVRWFDHARPPQRDDAESSLFLPTRGGRSIRLERRDECEHDAAASVVDPANGLAAGTANSASTAARFGVRCAGADPPTLARTSRRATRRAVRRWHTRRGRPHALDRPTAHPCCSHERLATPSRSIRSRLGCTVFRCRRWRRRPAPRGGSARRSPGSARAVATRHASRRRAGSARAAAGRREVRAYVWPGLPCRRDTEHA